MSPLTLLDDRPPVITAWTLVPSSVDGDITIQWEWSKLDPRQNPNPSIDHDKFLHNWLRPWDKLVTQIWYKSVVRERLAKYVKYKASFLFLFLFFSQRLAYWSDPSADFDTQWFNLRGITQGCAFLGSAWRRVTFRGSNSPKTLYKGGVVRQSQPSQRKVKISISSKLNNVFEWNSNTLMTLPNAQHG